MAVVTSKLEQVQCDNNQQKAKGAARLRRPVDIVHGPRACWVKEFTVNVRVKAPKEVLNRFVLHIE